METSLIIELHNFLTSIYGGLISGFIYDIYKTKRYYSKPNKFITYLEDLLFWIIIAFIFFFVLIKVSWGQIRGYILIGFVLGIFIYSRVFSPFIYPICIKIGNSIKNVVRGLFGAVIYPFKFAKSKSSPIYRKLKNIPIEIIRRSKRYKKIISSKK